MRNLASRTRFGVLLLVGLVSAMFADVASAGVKVVVHTGGTLWNYKMSCELPCGTPIFPLPGMAGKNLPCGFFKYLTSGPSATGGRCIITAGCFGGVAYGSAYPFVDACAGGENTVQALPDTLSASVGLYPPGGGIPDTSLMMGFAIIRTTGNVRLVYLHGGLQTARAVVTDCPSADFRLAVYPNQAAADADSSNNSGAGSAFFGRATLLGNSGSIATQNGFGPSNWIVTNDGGGKFTATMTPGYTRDVPVGDANLAVVSLFGDPRTTAVGTEAPGHSPVGLTLLTLALLGGGIWVIRSRRTITAV